ncbi:DUF952 domain-containing protein [Nocardioides sp. LHG3406-4]|uniref:DUF952 domain-containing protein n=1 Tax=Nocardioides sp. LHG3406-4 TaxID=2804575 RepID=UPI003CF0F668
MHVFHIATAAEWELALASGSYTTSTRGRTLAEEGFIHASRREQVEPTFARFYRDVREPLVLLTIDTDRLGVPWREDPVGDDTFPHLYGALSPSAVVRVQPLDRRGGTGSLTGMFVGEMAWRMGLVLGVMLVSGLGATLGRTTGATWGPFLGALAGLALGGAVAWAVSRRRA